jgi:hypothetical protein
MPQQHHRSESSRLHADPTARNQLTINVCGADSLLSSAVCVDTVSAGGSQNHVRAVLAAHGVLELVLKALGSVDPDVARDAVRFVYRT